MSSDSVGEPPKRATAASVVGGVRNARRTRASGASTSSGGGAAGAGASSGSLISGTAARSSQSVMKVWSDDGMGPKIPPQAFLALVGAFLVMIVSLHMVTRFSKISG
ncbi:unnamed protein product [Amoebophrya sp. A25]|nr:unnamed protein product [Amoebophrya sp. A25]|eukprot:GSA25T00010095001.1